MMAVSKVKLSLGLVVLIFVALLGFFFAKRTSGRERGEVEDSQGRVTVTALSYDWGEIDIDSGKVEAVFEIKNEGTGLLELSGVRTSCMCTTAQLLYQGEVSPEFGMHSRSSYVLSLPPGEIAQLRVVFDPAYHGPNGIGEITRQVLVKTSDPANPKLSFNLKAKVVKRGFRGSNEFI